MAKAAVLDVDQRAVLLLQKVARVEREHAVGAHMRELTAVVEDLAAQARPLELALDHRYRQAGTAHRRIFQAQPRRQLEAAFERKLETRLHAKPPHSMPTMHGKQRR